MLRKFLMLAAVLMIIAITPPVSAEQAAAEQYRQLISSGKFFLEYSYQTHFSDKNSKSAREFAQYEKYYAQAYVQGEQIGWDDGKKKSCSKKFSPDGRKSSYEPAVFYTDGKCYKFQNANKATLFENVSSENELILPAFFSALLPDSPNVSHVSGGLSEFNEVSTLIESGTENIFGQDFNYDRYAVKFFDSAGNELGKFTYPKTGKKYDRDFSSTYTYYYNSSGELKYVKEEGFARLLVPRYTSLNSMDGVEIYISIDKFTGNIPTGFFNFPKGCKVYRDNAGTLDDLLENEELVEQY